MSTRVDAGVGRVEPGQVDGLVRDLAGARGIHGVVLLDPGDGVHPLVLASRVRGVRPDWPVVVPLVSRDRNRTALLAEVRGAEALGATGLLVLAGHLEPVPAARPVYEMDPAQMMGWLRECGVGLELWAMGRCATPAERARCRVLARVGADRLLVPADGMPPPPDLGAPEPVALAEGGALPGPGWEGRAVVWPAGPGAVAPPPGLPGGQA